MNEQEWLENADPQSMLDFLQGRTSERKLRLFACACCRRIWNLLLDQRSRNAVMLAELFADGSVSPEELRIARSAADRAHFESRRNSNFRALDAAPNAAEEEMSCAADVSACTADAAEIAFGRDSSAKEKELIEQAAVLRCIAGNPFRAVQLDPARLARQDGAIVNLAQRIYNERAFADLPMLADALEKAGCTNPELLAHCRQPGPHVRGCWAVDLLLGKN